MSERRRERAVAFPVDWTSPDTAPAASFCARCWTAFMADLVSAADLVRSILYAVKDREGTWHCSVCGWTIERVRISD